MSAVVSYAAPDGKLAVDTGEHSIVAQFDAPNPEIAGPGRAKHRRLVGESAAHQVKVEHRCRTSGIEHGGERPQQDRREWVPREIADRAWWA